MSRIFKLIATCVVAASLNACAAPPPLEFSLDNVPQTKNRIDAQLRSVSVKTAQNDNDAERVDWFRIENATGINLVVTSTGTGIPITRQWEQALNDALTQNLAFRDNASRTVSLFVEISKVQMSGMGTTHFEVVAAYRLQDRDTGTIIYRDIVASSGDASTGEAFTGAVRARIAFVRSVRANISQFLTDLENRRS